MFINFKDRTTDMNLEALQVYDNYCKLYDVITSHHLTSGSPTLILGENSFQCRFCGKEEPETTFLNEAHAIPESAGNRTLLSHWECDSCNGKFGRSVETHFASFMHLNHTIFGVKGKKGYRKFKTGDGTNIETTGSFIDWNGVPEENIRHDIENRQLHVKQKMPTYVPIAVYKALVKMAMTVMPEAELGCFLETLEWLAEDTYEDSAFTLTNLWMVYGSFESTSGWDQLSVVLAKRKETNTTLPYMLFSLNYANFSFQLPIPLCSRDEGRFFDYSSITYLPHLLDLKNGFGKMQLTALNMNSTEPQVGQEIIFTITDLDGSGTVTYVDCDQ